MSQDSFNAIKACFWLVAFVIGAHVVAALAVEGVCLYHSDAIIEGKIKCNSEGKLTEVLAAALAAALAFAGGFMHKPNNAKDSDGDQNER